MTHQCNQAVIEKSVAAFLLAQRKCGNFVPIAMTNEAITGLKSTCKEHRNG